MAFLEIFLLHCGMREMFSGALGVSVFFVLSGFCMGINYLPKLLNMNVSLKDNVAWAWKRIRKIYPIHILMMMASIVLVKFKVTLKDILLIIPNVFLFKCLIPDIEVCFSWYPDYT